jgi:hypothetical protein
MPHRWGDNGDENGLDCGFQIGVTAVGLGGEGFLPRGWFALALRGESSNLFNDLNAGVFEGFLHGQAPLWPQQGMKTGIDRAIQQSD